MIDFTSPQAIARDLREAQAENRCLLSTIDELKAADRDHLAAKNGMEKRLQAEIDRLREENRKLRAEVSRSSYHCD